MFAMEYATERHPAPFAPSVVVGPAAQPRSGPKFLLYSHDTFGLGNIRRTVLVAEMLANTHPGAAILIVTGSQMMHAFRIPAGMDYIKLPCLDRGDADRYHPRFLANQDGEVLRVRRALLEQAILGFAPDLLLVDKRAAGIDGELLGALRTLHRRPGRPRLVLGLRDILDEPERTKTSLARARDMDTIARFYDEVWIYGERTIFDAVREYGFPDDVARRTHYCGYLKRPTRPQVARTGSPSVLVTAGGGGDGTDLITTYLEGLSALPRSVALRTTVIFGPQMPDTDRVAIRARYEAISDVTFVDFEPDMTARYAEADLVVSMAGYNTVCELLSFARRAILVPRAEPVREQLMRARLFAARGFFGLVEPAELTPEVLMARIRERLTQPTMPKAGIDLDGLPRIQARVRSLLTEVRS